MKIERLIKNTFTVIGKEGSTEDGADFVRHLWDDADSHFAEVSGIAKKDENGNIVGVWGAMTDYSRSFNPWEDGFSKGLYLAGVECENDAKAPDGWTKWVIPGFEYLRAECDEPDIFPKMLNWLEEHRLSLAGAVQDFTDPLEGKSYMLFPIGRL